MARFEKTGIHPATAVLCLLGLYALAGLAYAAFMHSGESVVIWAIVASLSFIAAVAFQSWVRKKRGATRDA